MNGPFDSRDVAAYIARRCSEKGYTYNNTKIQKLLYCVYGVILAERGEIICDEDPRCWPYGPVFPRVFKYIDNGGQIACYPCSIAEKMDSETLSIINDVVDHFGQFTAKSLSNWSHLPDSPWDKTKKENEGKWNSPIPVEYILPYFKTKVISD